MVVPAILTSTNIDPMKSLMKRAMSWEQRDNVVNVAVFSGFYGSEQYEAGTSVVAILLKHIMDNGLRSAGVSTIRDPEIVQAVVKAGVGGRVKGILGGKTDEFHGEPVAIDAKALGIKSDMIPREYYDLDTLQDVGNIAILDHDGIIIVVTELRCNAEKQSNFLKKP